MFAQRRGMWRHAPRSATAQSGPLPEIRLQGESVVFYIQVATGHGPSRLLLRCDPAGEVWASLDDGADRRSSQADRA
jgi:hypothetical protein